MFVQPESGDIYQDLVSLCFPQARPGSVVCYELYAIHLSLLPLDFVGAQSLALVRFLQGNTDN